MLRSTNQSPPSDAPVAYRRRLRNALLVAVALALALTTAIVPWRAQTASAGTGLNYTVVDADNDPYSGIYLRDGTAMANVRRIGERYMLYGTAVELICGTWGESVGPYANRRWHNVRVANGATVNQVGWIADRYLNTPNVANQATPGEPECGATPPPPTTPPPPPPTSPLPAESASQMIWIGAPTTGNWPSNLVDSPAQHWIPYGGQWGLDFSGNADKTVNLYVAPKNNALNNRINAKVESSGPACKFRGAYGKYRAETPDEQINRGGYKVVVGIYDGNTKVATITYAHLKADRAANGTIGRWGGKLGTVGTWTKTNPRPGVPTDTLCWNGAHVHVEPRNQSGNACYMQWGYGQTLTENTYLGYVGYSVGSTKTACPSGI